jgi:hypothetical protein
MRTTKKILSMILATLLVLGLLPATAFATGAGNVYISVSYDGKYINDKNGGYIAYVAVPMETVAAINLDDYGLSDYWYDEDGDGNYETTALQLIIYAHENIYGGSWSDVDFTGSAGSSYFQGGIFGFDENLNYYLNGQYPLAGEGWGATSDQIVLEAGDFIDMASFSSWDFYQDSGYGFHFFADGNGDIAHSFTVEEGSSCDVKLIKGSKDYEYNSVFMDVPSYCVHYGEVLYHEDGQVYTDSDACASITFPEAGTYYLWVDGGYGNEYSNAIVSAPGYATVTVTEKEEEPAPEEPREPQDVSAVLNATMTQLAATVTEPVFGTTAGEWTVLSLARGGYYAKDNTYFTNYYDRIVETVNTTAASVNMNGALHKNKSTENSRLIVALSAIGKDATSVGDWDLVEAYSANGFSWIQKQGLNGTIWALIALDSNNYATTDSSIRQQCIDSILSLQHDDGGWALQANLAYASDPDVTGMALTALYPYRNQPKVAAAAEEAFACLSAMQHENGTFASGGSECAESCAWVIVSTTTWGINPDTDSRFIKNGKSVVDALLTHYLPDSATFQHIIGAGSNAMATDQSCYGLVAYDRFINGKAALYDYSDVTFEDAAPETDEMTATLGLPAEINGGDSFNGVISINKWDNEAGYKLIDLIVNVPEGVTVTDVTASDRLAGGELSWNLEAETGKLRVVYFDANENTTLTITGEEFPAELFTVSFKAESVDSGSKLSIALSGMSVKLTSDSEDEASMIVVNTDNAKGTIDVVVGISFSAVCLYTGDDVDLISATKKAVAVAVTGIKNGTKLTYNDGTNTVEFKYSAEISAKTGVSTYVAIVDETIAMENFVNESYFSIPGGDATAVSFGDTNGDGVINAQDALAVVDTWLRKGEEPTDDQILTMNVNGDSRINTFDALGIVEKFVSGSEYGVVTKAATITTKQ